MWTFSITEPHFADEKLASLSVESPTNLRAIEGFGLLVALWCGRVRDHFYIGDDAHEFSFGFHIGEIVIDLAGGRISNLGRLSLEAAQVKIAQSETDAAKKEGSVGAQLGINPGRWLGSLGKAEAGVGGRLNRTISKTEQKDTSYSHTSWRVADAGHNFWRVFGSGLNSNNVLEHKVLGDEPLCHIVAEQDSNLIELVVSFRCDLRDVWFQHEDSPDVSVDARFAKEQSERNRTAIAARICAIALSRSGTSSEQRIDRTVILAQQSLRAIREIQADGTLS